MPQLRTILFAFLLSFKCKYNFKFQNVFDLLTSCVTNATNRV